MMENTTGEIRITTGTLTEESTAQIVSKAHESRMLIETKKNKRGAVEMGQLMHEDHADEERTPRSSQISLPNQTTQERERDAALVSYQATVRDQTTKLTSLERGLAASLVANEELRAERDGLHRENAQLRPLANATVRLQRELDETFFAMKVAQERSEEIRMSEFHWVDKYKQLEVAAGTALQQSRMRLQSQIARLRKSLKSLEIRTEQDRESLAMVRSLQADKQKLVAELDEQKHKADAQIQALTSEKTSLRNELDTARIAIQAGQTEYDDKHAVVQLEKEKLETILALVESERDATPVASAQPNALVMKLFGAELATVVTTKETLDKKLEHAELERGATRLELNRQKTSVMKDLDDKLTTQKPLGALLKEVEGKLKVQKTRAGGKRKLESDMFLIREEAAEGKRRLVKSDKNEWDEARTEMFHLRTELEQLRDEKSRREKLEYDFSLTQTEAAENERRLEQAHSDIFHLTKALKDENNRRKKLANDIGIIQKTAVEYERELRQALLNISQLNKLFGAERNRVERLESEVDFTQEEAAEEKRKLMQAHKNELDKTRTDIAHLKMELESLREEKNGLESKVGLQEEAAEETRKLLHAQKNELDEATADLQILKKELEASWEERNRLERLEYDVGRVQEAAAEDKIKLVQTLMELHETQRVSNETKIDYETKIESLREEKKRLEKLKYDIRLIKKEAAQAKRRLVRAHKNEVDQTGTQITHLKLELDSVRKDKNRLVTTHETTVKHLEEERERSLCQICLDSPKNAISYPCMHFHYCFSCLEKHRMRSNTCPSCRTTISGLTHLSLVC